MERQQYLPVGVRDWTGEQLELKRELLTRMENVFQSHGFDPVESPLFEYYEVYGQERGSIKPQNMYKIMDREGHLLVLRPDLTPAIARVVGGTVDDQTPTQIYSIGKTYRYLTDHNQQRESTQASLELMGDGSVEADARMVAISVETLKNMGVKDFKIDLGNVNFFKGLIEEAGLSEEEVADLNVIMEGKNMDELKSFLEDHPMSQALKEVFLKMPTLFGEREILNTEFQNLNNKSKEAIQQLMKVADILEELGMKEFIGFDLSMVSRLNYYTGLIFNGYTYGYGGAIVCGGRYDELLMNFGEKRPAVGFGILIDELIYGLRQQKLDLKVPKKPCQYLFYEKGMMAKAYDLSRHLSKENDQLRVNLYPLTEGRDVEELKSQYKNLMIMRETGLEQYMDASENLGRKMKDERTDNSFSQGKTSQGDTKTFWESRH